jgi:hypothetical protein
MGTRNLTMVLMNNEIRVAQYGQWDGYPTGSGVSIFTFLRNMLNSHQEQIFQQKVNLSYSINDLQEEEILKKIAESLNIVYIKGCIDNNNYSKLYSEYDRQYPQINRDMGAEILDFILSAEKPFPLYLSTDFAKDSLFCEWAYLVNFDSRSVEVYRGFNKEPLTEEDRFFYLSPSEKEIEKEKRKYGENEFFYPIKKIKEYSFNDIQTWKNIKSRMQNFEKNS